LRRRISSPYRPSLIDTHPLFFSPPFTIASLHRNFRRLFQRAI
jgi:hypothetical protein